jgi:hypothetical protein
MSLNIWHTNVAPRRSWTPMSAFVWHLTERWIGYPKASFALNRLRHLIDYPARDRMPCLLLYGATGMGKTKILKMFIRSHPVSVTSQTGPSSIPIVLVQMPPEPDEKSFYLELLHAMNATLPVRTHDGASPSHGPRPAQLFEIRRPEWSWWTKSIRYWRARIGSNASF